MTVNELIGMLKKTDGESEVYVSEDLDLETGIDITDVISQQMAGEVTLLTG